MAPIIKAVGSSLSFKNTPADDNYFNVLPIKDGNMTFAEGSVNTNGTLANGFAVLSINEEVKNFGIFDFAEGGCKVAEFIEFNEKIKEKDSVGVAFGPEWSKDSMKDCTSTEKHQLYEIFGQFGSAQAQKILSAAARNVKDKRFDIDTKMENTENLKLAIFGFKCQEVHSAAFIDASCKRFGGEHEKCGSDQAEELDKQTENPHEFRGCPAAAILGQNVYFFVIWILAFYPWVMMIKDVKAQEHNWIDSSGCSKILQLDSFRTIQDDRDKEDAILEAGGYYTAEQHKAMMEAGKKLEINLDPLKKVGEEQLAYWNYKDLAEYDCGPYSSVEMRERYDEKNFQMDERTQIKESWWPEGIYYDMGEIFEEPKDYFTIKPKLPLPVKELIEETIKEHGDSLPSPRLDRVSSAVLGKRSSEMSQRQQSLNLTRVSALGKMASSADMQA